MTLGLVLLVAVVAERGGAKRKAEITGCVGKVKTAQYESLPKLLDS